VKIEEITRLEEENHGMTRNPRGIKLSEQRVGAGRWKFTRVIQRKMISILRRMASWSWTWMRRRLRSR
jgi:hypothetical protein